MHPDRVFPGTRHRMRCFPFAVADNEGHISFALSLLSLLCPLRNVKGKGRDCSNLLSEAEQKPDPTTYRCEPCLNQFGWIEADERPQLREVG
jgi:hypothetical protein